MGAAIGFGLIVMSVASVRAQEPIGRFVDRVFRDDAGEQKYVVFVPAGYRSNKPSPAILFLHGAGERGKDNRQQLTAGLAPFVQARLRTFPFIVVFPQCRQADGRILDSWKSENPGGQLAISALEDARKNYNFDAKRVVLTGWSMGGYGVWNLGISEPDRWSALVPLSGGGDATDVARLKEIPVWGFHGKKDAFVKPEDGRHMVDALVAAGGTAAFTELPEGGHDISEDVYGNDEIFAWMQAPLKTTRQLGAATVKPVAVFNPPFVPAIEISQAVGIRLGNDVLDAFAHSIPQSVSRDLLSGRLNDMFDSTVASGRQFSIRFSGISYNGQLERVVARGWANDRILVQLGIRNITLTIGGSSVSGARHSAQAGPITIAIGHREPVWFNLEVSPYIADRRIRLRLVSSGFHIPDGNWSVSQPAGVSIQGFGMTQEAVVSGLTRGLYGAKGRIENEVTSIAPRVVAEIEKQLTLPESVSNMSQSDSTISGIWLLPISAPRIQVWPEQISADQNGISLITGLTVGSLDPYGPVRPLKFANAKSLVANDTSAALPQNVSLARLPSDTSMHVIVTPGILTPLTEMYASDDRTRIDLLDIPEPLFTALADRSTLQEIIPDLKQHGDTLQVRSTLKLVKPLAAGGPQSGSASEKTTPLEIRFQGIQVNVSTKTSATGGAWSPCATFELSLAEQMRPDLQKPFHDRRTIGLDWLPATSVTGTGKFAEGYSAANPELDVDRYVELFKQAWITYSAGLKTTQTEVPDLQIGASKMRIADVQYTFPNIDVTYRLARIKLSNLSDQPFTYQTKAPTSSWGESLTLKPGASHEFEIPYPLTYRRNLPTGSEVYTLSVGSHSEFRIPVTGGAPRLFAARR